MNEGGIRALTELKRHEKALIVALAGGREFQSRLVSMGLYVGSEVEVLQPSNGAGGATHLATGETRLAIGFGMAAKIVVAVDSA